MTLHCAVCSTPARLMRALPVRALRPLGGGRYVAVAGRWRLHVVVTRAGAVHLAAALPLH